MGRSQLQGFTCASKLCDYSFLLLLNHLSPLQQPEIKQKFLDFLKVSFQGDIIHSDRYSSSLLL